MFEATDSDTGEPVVVKRTHPTLVSRKIHHSVEIRIRLQAELRGRIEDTRHLVRLHLLTEPDNFDWYFGDDPGEQYSVQVEDRAKGIPLVGGISDLVRGHPVALPLNLFALHPSKAFVSSGYEHPSMAALAVIERIYEEGYLAQDLGPQNVFYSPASRESVVIDLGTLREPSEATRRRPAFDLNDILFDLFRLYSTPDPPPRHAAQFAQNRESGLSGTLERKTETLSREFADADAGRAEISLQILSTIAERGYDSPALFRSDFREYLAAADSADRDSAVEQAWHEALQRLRSPYWEKYLFDADIELD